MRVYHLGHSLVGRDMPAMLAQLAGEGHRYESQLGWGATLKAHWGDDTVAGFAEENAHPRFRAAREAADSADYDAVVLTEMVEIRDAIRYHDSPAYLRRWADRILGARPDARVFLFETWHPLDDPEGWLNRLDRDLGRYWEGELLARAQADGELAAGDPRDPRRPGDGAVRQGGRGARRRRRNCRRRRPLHRHDPPERPRDIPRRPHPLRRALPAQPGRPAAAAQARRRHARSAAWTGSRPPDAEDRLGRGPAYPKTGVPQAEGEGAADG